MQHPEHKHIKGQRLIERSRTQFYVYAVIGNRPMLWGGYPTRSQAEHKGMMEANGAYEVFDLEAPNVEAAGQILREKGILGQGEDSFRRFKHI